MKNITAKEFEFRIDQGEHILELLNEIAINHYKHKI